MAMNPVEPRQTSAGGAWPAWVLAGAVCLFLGVTAWVNLHNMELSFLSLRTVDEDAIYRIAERMYRGLAVGPWRDFFNIIYFSYGFVYFFLLWLVTLPGHLLARPEVAVFAARMLSAGFAAATMLLLYRWVSVRAGSRAWGMAAALALLALPEFWVLAMLIRPDHGMNFLVLACLVLLDLWRPRDDRRRLLAGAALLTAAMSFKLQAGLYAPAVALLLVVQGWREQNWRPAGLGRGLSRAVVVGVLCLVLYFLFNPYMFHPLGLHYWWRELTGELASNATDHFAFVLPSLGLKLAHVARHYMPIWLGVALVALSLGLAALPTRRDRLAPAAALIAAVVLPGVYLLTQVAKVWTQYYLTPFTLLPVLVFMLLPAPAGAASSRQRWAGLALALVLAVQGVPAVWPMVKAMPRPEAAARELRRQVGRALTGLVSPGSVLAVSPGLPVPFKALGLPYHQVLPIPGALPKEYIAQADILVISKHDDYFTGPVGQDSPWGRQLAEARRRLDAMVAGRDPKWALVRQTPDLLVFRARGKGAGGSS